MVYKYIKTKKCLDCDEIIVIKSGKEKRCSICQKEYLKKYFKKYCQLHPKSKEKIKEYCQRWRLKHPERAKEVLREYRERNLELCRERTRLCQIKLNDKNRFGGLRLKVLKRDNYKCQKCGKDISGKYMAGVHHINGNKSDNRMKNLIAICKVCHSFLHYKERKLDKKGNFIG